MPVFHRTFDYTENHVAHSLEFADATARNAYAGTAADIGRIARQLDTGAFYILQAAPATWSALEDGVASHVAAPDPHTQYVLEASLPTEIATYLDRSHAQNSTPADNDTTTYTDFITHTPTFAHTAQYKITVHFYWSLNDGGQDFRSRILVGGTPISAQVHQQEPKDTAGAGPFGTNQRHLGVITGFVNATAGAQNIQFQWSGSAAGDSAAIYDANIYVERWL